MKKTRHSKRRSSTKSDLFVAILLVLGSSVAGCAVLSAPPAGAALQTPGTPWISLALGTEISPYRAHYRTVNGQSLIRSGAATGEARRPWNYAGVPVTSGAPVLWGIPQVLTVRYGLGPRWDLGVHAGWLAAGASARHWLVPLDETGTGAALTFDGQHDYFNNSWEVRGMSELHRRFSHWETWIGAGASVGLRRHVFALPDRLSPWYGLDGFPLPGTQPEVRRGEGRLELILGLTRIYRTIGASTVTFQVTVAPFWIVRAGQPDNLCAAAEGLQYGTRCLVEIDEFHIASYGGMVTLSGGAAGVRSARRHEVPLAKTK